LFIKTFKTFQLQQQQKIEDSRKIQIRFVTIKQENKVFCKPLITILLY